MVAADGDKTFNITADSNYKILDVMVDGTSVGSVSSHTFQNISANHTIHASFTVDFIIDDGAVKPLDTFNATATVLGAAITSGASGYDMMVTSCIKVGNDTFDLWGDYTKAFDANVNDNNNPRTDKLPGSYPAQTPITIKGCSWQKKDSSYTGNINDHWEVNMEKDSNDNSPNVKVLKNGDEVPPIPGFADQSSIEEFVRDYVEDGKMKLDENEAIYLFELGTTDLNSSAADFQDLVVLLSLESANTTAQSDITAEQGIEDEKATATQASEYSRIIIQHRGGDTLDFSSIENTKVLFNDGNNNYVLNTTDLELFQVGDTKVLNLVEYGTNKSIEVNPGDSGSIMIIDVGSNFIVYEEKVSF